MKRPVHIAAVFAASLAVLLGALAWVSVLVVRLDREQAEAQRVASFEEDVRLALWRMDSKAAPLIARENSRPYFVYSAYYPVDGGDAEQGTRARQEVQQVVQSPVARAPENILLHFEMGAGGEMRSPQVGEGARERLAEFWAKAGEAIEKTAPAEERVAFEVATASQGGVADTMGQGTAQAPEQQARMSKGQQEYARQTTRNAEEFQRRASNISYQNAFAVPDVLSNAAIVGSSNVRMTVMRPAWIGDMLVLARRVVIGKETRIQGCWVDWQGIREWLLADVRPLLPEADLEAVRSEADADGARMLAALPVRLVPGPMPQGDAGVSPVMMSLVFAWVSILVAAGAVGALLYGAVALSERRAAFVSAVTHELRSPLTTFRLYADLLAGGMVADEEKRGEYYRTLCREAERLSHLVENVLAYSRLERGRPGGHVAEITLGQLIERCVDRLRNRCEAAGMTLEVSAGGAAGAGVLADAAAAEQILFNLVDNACKYASCAQDKRIIITGAATGAGAQVTVMDFGPGLSAQAAARLFRPFSKSAGDAAASAPGVGLGLSLSRRLARSMGADLECDGGRGRGAAFTLTLPLADGRA